MALRSQVARCAPYYLRSGIQVPLAPRIPASGLHPGFYKENRPARPISAS